MHRLLAVGTEQCFASGSEVRGLQATYTFWAATNDPREAFLWPPMKPSQVPTHLCSNDPIVMEGTTSPMRPPLVPRSTHAPSPHLCSSDPIVIEGTTSPMRPPLAPRSTASRLKRCSIGRMDRGRLSEVPPPCSSRERRLPDDPPPCREVEEAAAAASSDDLPPCREVEEAASAASSDDQPRERTLPNVPLPCRERRLPDDLPPCREAADASSEEEMLFRLLPAAAAPRAMPLPPEGFASRSSCRQE